MSTVLSSRTVHTQRSNNNPSSTFQPYNHNHNIESLPEEQVSGEDLVGELLKSLSGTRGAAHNREKKWRSVLIEMNFDLGTWSPAIVCCRERDVCGVAHGIDACGVDGISAQ